MEIHLRRCVFGPALQQVGACKLVIECVNPSEYIDATTLDGMAALIDQHSMIY
jgi:hypothetical protein